MADSDTLRNLREQTFFLQWKGFVPQQALSDSEACLRQLVDDLIGLGHDPGENDVRNAVAKCIKRFNELDVGWINTIEREDICDGICKVVEMAGFECEDDWLDDREW